MTKPPSPPYVGPAAHISAGANKPIHRVVIHCTVSPTVEGGARDIARYFKTQGAGGSAHYVVDPGEVVQSVFDSRIAQHAPPNQHSLGVELCDPMVGSGDRWDNRAHRAMLTIAAKLVAQLCAAYDVPIRKLTVADLKEGRHGICGHVDVSNAWHESTHWDPGPDFPWKRFIAQVAAFAHPDTPPIPAGPVEVHKPTTKPAPAEEELSMLLYRTAAVTTAYELSGGALVPVSKARADAVRAAGVKVHILTLPDKDALWKLPKVGV